MTRPVDYAETLLECLRTAIHASPYDIPDEKICLRFGEVVNPTLGTGEDECCTGLAWVRVAGIEPLRADPDNTEYGLCATGARRLTLEIGTARCIPVGTMQAGPTCDQWTEAALKMDSDQACIERALCCLGDQLDTLRGTEAAVPGEYLPGGPDGNCITGAMTVTIDYSCGCGS